MTTDPRIQALRAYAALGGITDERHMASLTIHGAPHVKRRPRFAHGVAYTDPANRIAEQSTRAAMQAARLTRHDGPVVLVCVFFTPTRRRVDTDNLLKHVMDAGTGVLYGDDHQVHRHAALLVQADPRPRTLILAGPLTTGDPS